MSDTRDKASSERNFRERGWKKRKDVGWLCPDHAPFKIKAEVRR